MFRLPPLSTPFPYTTLFRSRDAVDRMDPATRARAVAFLVAELPYHLHARFLAALVAMSMGDYARAGAVHGPVDRKSTRLNSSHLGISYAVFCLKKKRPTTKR